MMTEMQVVVTSALVILVGLFAFTIGMWVGHGKRDEAEEAELERAVAWHAAGRHRTDAARPGYLLELPQAGEYGPFPVTEEEYLLLTVPPAGPDPGRPETWAFPGEDQAAAPRHGIPRFTIAEDGPVTAWTKAMAADMDAYIKTMAEESNMIQHLMRDQP